MKIRAILALILALTLVIPAAMADYGEYAIDEEDSANVFEVLPGTYEWYQLASDYEDGHAYLEIWPAEETVTMKDGAWSYTFNMEEVGGVDFHPYSVILVGFCDDIEISRNVFTAETFTDWWTGEIPAGTTVTYSGTEHQSILTALAISVIGTDSEGWELEFHSIVYLTK